MGIENKFTFSTVVIPVMVLVEKHINLSKVS